MSSASQGQDGHGGEFEFSDFLLSLASNIQLHLDRSDENFDLTMAHQMIEILAMLEKKTAGNLTAEESDLLRAILYRTRLAYADVRKAAEGA